MIDRIQTEQDRQSGKGRTGRHSRTGIMGKAEWNRRNGTGRTGQADGKDRMGQAEWNRQNKQAEDRQAIDDRQDRTAKL
jgi:hypothetical protein